MKFVHDDDDDDDDNRINIYLQTPTVDVNKKANNNADK